MAVCLPPFEPSANEKSLICLAVNLCSLENVFLYSFLVKSLWYYIRKETIVNYKFNIIFKTNCRTNETTNYINLLIYPHVHNVLQTTYTTHFTVF